MTRSSSKVQPQESGLQQRTVIVEFDSYENALAAYDSEAYKKPLPALGSGAERDFRIGEGVTSRQGAEKDLTPRRQDAKSSELGLGLPTIDHRTGLVGRSLLSRVQRQNAKTPRLVDLRPAVFIGQATSITGQLTPD